MLRRNIVVFIGCLLVCLGAYRWGNAGFEIAKKSAVKCFYLEVTEMMFPMLSVYDKTSLDLISEDMERMIVPILADVDGAMGQDKKNESSNEIILPSEQYTPIEIVGNTIENDSDTVAGSNVSILENGKQVEINRQKLQDFDYLLQNFYQVDASTTVGKELLDVEKLLSEDLTLDKSKKGPQVLIYHTHSQEGYSDSKEGEQSQSVVAVGDYLTQLLQEEYGLEVLHHKGEYDLPNRDSAYSKALPELERILRENPTIEVVIDLHRDGVPESAHLVTEINGKPTAQIMFFNGISRTTAQGELEYLKNPYTQDNLAFSFQMQLAAEEYYPGFARRIYLKGYRYNMHLCPKSLLVEVGAQTNSFEEARNAMEPLARILGLVLLDE